MPDNNSTSDELSSTFLGMLTHDVLVAFERLDINDSQTSRRDFIRTLFAAVEGLVWHFREHVRSSAADLDELSPLLAMAMTESSYSVNDRGEVVEQQRYISLLSMIRLITNTVQKLSPELAVDFSNAGWSDLKQTVTIRNRVTHPKTLSDLSISSKDTKTAWNALIWLLDHVTLALDATNAAQLDHLQTFRGFVEQLKAGDPTAIALYRATLIELD